MRALAAVLEKMPSRDLRLFPDSILKEEAAIGGAAYLCFLRDCLTKSAKDVWTREELLVLLETMSRDGEMFPCGIGSLMWEMEDEGE